MRVLELSKPQYKILHGILGFVEEYSPKPETAESARRFRIALEHLPDVAIRKKDNKEFHIVAVTDEWVVLTSPSEPERNAFYMKPAEFEADYMN